MMDLGTLGTLIALIITIGGVLLTVHWFTWAKPKVEKVVEEKVGSCKKHQGDMIEKGFDKVSGQLEILTDEVKYTRKRFDQHVNGHAHD
jgi:hypothetical protein